MLNYHASDYLSIKNQVAIKATETVKAKLTFEREDKSQELMIKVYPTDTFNTSKFMENFSFILSAWHWISFERERYWD